MGDPRRILIIQLKRAGDVIVTTPILPVLKSRFPGVEIHFLTEPAFAPLLEENPNLTQIQPFYKERLLETWSRLRRARYDWVIDFQSSPRSVFAGLATGAPVRAGYQVTFWGHFFTHSVPRPGGHLSVVEGKMNLVRELVGAVGEVPARRVYLNDAERKVALAYRPGESPVGLIPTHRHSSRRWHADSFVALGQKCRTRQIPVWLFWGPGEEQYVREIEAQIPGATRIPPTSFRSMAGLLARCRLVVTNDNGPMHLAVAMGTPTVTIYGPTDPLAWNPGGPDHRIARANDVPCLGCNLNRCPIQHQCMTHLSPETVFSYVESLLAHPSRTGSIA